MSSSHEVQNQKRLSENPLELAPQLNEVEDQLYKNSILIKATQRFFQKNKGDEEKPVNECIRVFNNFRIRQNSPSSRSPIKPQDKAIIRVNPPVAAASERRSRLASPSSSTPMLSFSQRETRRVSPNQRFARFKEMREDANSRLNSSSFNGQSDEHSDNVVERQKKTAAAAVWVFEDINKFSAGQVLPLDDSTICQAIQNLGLTIESLTKWIDVSDFYSIHESMRMQMRRYLTALNEVFFSIEAIIKERDRLVAKHLLEITKQRKDEILFNNDHFDGSIQADRKSSSTQLPSTKSYKITNQQSTKFPFSQDFEVSTGLAMKRKRYEEKELCLKDELRNRLEEKKFVEQRLTDLRIAEAVKYERAQRDYLNKEKIKEERVALLQEIQHKFKQDKLTEHSHIVEEKKQMKREREKIDERKRLKAVRKIQEEEIKRLEHIEQAEEEKRTKERIKRELYAQEKQQQECSEEKYIVKAQESIVKGRTGSEGRLKKPEKDAVKVVLSKLRNSSQPLEKRKKSVDKKQSINEPKKVQVPPPIEHLLTVKYSSCLSRLNELAKLKQEEREVLREERETKEFQRLERMNELNEEQEERIMLKQRSLEERISASIAAKEKLLKLRQQEISEEFSRKQQIQVQAKQVIVDELKEKTNVYLQILKLGNDLVDNEKEQHSKHLEDCNLFTLQSSKNRVEFISSFKRVQKEVDRLESEGKFI